MNVELVCRCDEQERQERSIYFHSKLSFKTN